MSDLIAEVRDRRVVPAVGVYVGGSWVLIEILDRLVERYLLSPYITDIAFWGLFSLIPAVILVAWTHGKPGKDTVTTAEKVGIPINLIATLGLLITMFSGKDLGATANLVTVSDEHGQTVQQYVARESYRRRVATFFWENTSGDPQFDVLRYAVTELLTQDLQQSPFIVATSPYNSGTNGYFARMAQAGFDDGLGLPTSLMRQIAREANRDYFIDGSIDRADGDYLLTARVWDASTGREAGTVEERGHELYAVVDRLSRGVREVLDVPFEGRAAEDLALADTYGESRAALQAYIEGLNHRLLENDLAAADEAFNRALAEDPQFVLAWLMKAVGAAQSGNLPVAREAFEEAQALDYRLPSRDRSIIKANLYWLSGETEKLESFLRMQVRLNDDARSWRLLGNVLLELGKFDEAREAYKTVLERDASELDMLKVLALLERGVGDLDRSIGHLRAYVEERPEDVGALLQLGDLLRDAGRREDARAMYADAQFVGNRPVLPLLRLAMLDMGAGDAPSAWSLLGEARELAETPDQKSVVLGVQSTFEMREGRIHDALETTRKKMAHDRRFQPPVALALGGHAQLAYLHMVIGELEQARAALADAQQMLAAPMDQFLGFTEASLLAREGDAEAAAEALEQGTAIVNQFQMQQMQFLVYIARADVAHVQRNYEVAADAMQRALEEINASVIAGLPELAAVVPEMYGQLASYRVRSGDPVAARAPLDEGFKRDGAHPVLWLARAEHQFATGEVDLARASIDYTLALWRDADPDYVAFTQAQALAERIAAERVAAHP